MADTCPSCQRPLIEPRHSRTPELDGQRKPVWFCHETTTHIVQRPRRLARLLDRVRRMIQ
jgi:hypothetical protein